jgi:hypothetical protein
MLGSCGARAGRQRRAARQRRSGSVGTELDVESHGKGIKVELDVEAV